MAGYLLGTSYIPDTAKHFAWVLSFNPHEAGPMITSC